MGTDPPAPGEHYFSHRPASPERRQPLGVSLGGRDLELVSANGVFSADRLDTGTRVLLRHAVVPPAGDLLDLGCGWGPLSLAMGLAAPGASVWAVDVNERALRLTEENAHRAGLAGVRACRPDQVPADLRFAAIWSNPPIRIGKAALHALLLDWLPRLTPDGTGWLVVQRNLGADTLQGWLAEQLGPERRVRRAGSAKGFRVIEVGAAGGGGPRPPGSTSTAP